MLPKSDGKAELGAAPPFLERFVQSLHELPPVVRYYDDFDDETRSISNIRHADLLPLHVNGRIIRLSLTGFPESYRTLIKHLLVFMLGEDLHISTCSNVLGAAIHFSPSDIDEIVEASPTGILSVWMTLRARELPAHAYQLVKALLHFKCRHRWGGWSESYVAFVSHQLPNPAADAYARVRSGEVFLSAEAEAAIVRHIDRFAARLRAERSTLFPDYSELCDVAMTLCAYQFAMRPIQIAMLTQRDVRIWRPDPDGDASVHLTFLMAKQRGTSKKRPMVRRVKHEWGVVIEATVAAATAQHRRIDGRLFDVDSNHEAGERIARLVERLTGDDASAMYLRHTAAQRLVDAGANHEELAEFMGHSFTKTGLVYYAASASHAERVNRALGASEVYQRVAKIAHDRFISVEELEHLKDEQQIAGIPHGIPIAGIGGCSSGQPGCPYHPVTSCYGCPKFMPVRDKSMHEGVLGSMRQVVLFFEKSSRGDTKSPTYLQLRRTIGEIQNVVSEMEEGRA